MGRRIEINKEEILKMPVTTNKLCVSWDRQSFFERYSIVSYKTGTKSKNLSYEQLSDTPSLAVAGIWNRYEGNVFYTRFFVLTKKEYVKDILHSLRLHDDITAKTDDLNAYEENVQKRIVASLAINSLGVGSKGRMMYNNGSLLVCDDKNFGIPKSRKELVCLKVKVNRYMNLTAKATTFTNPRDIKDLKRHSNCVFSIGKEMDGFLWIGHTLKPITIKEVNEAKLKLDRLFIQGKRFKSTHNIVPYWPWSVEKYNHGRLFVLCQVMENVNQKYAGLLRLDFTSYPAFGYDEYRPKEDILNLLKEYFDGKSIYIEDPVGSDDSKKQAKNLRTELGKVTDSLVFPKKESKGSMVIRLCGSKENESTGHLYSKSLDRMARSTVALQHVTVTDNITDDDMTSAKARRILLELLVKDSISKRVMPSRLAEKTDGWNFFRWKIHAGRLFGASLKPAKKNVFDLTEYGFEMGLGEDRESFIRDEIGYENADKLTGSHDYMAMRKNGNTYLLIDTDEIPILDTKMIDEFYCSSPKKSGVITSFKNKQDAMNHRFLRGYIGFHIWKSEGMDGKDAYSYIAGWNSENMKTCGDFKIDKMPRARKIFIIKTANPEAVENDIQEITQMLKEDFGRWDELMTYPFPFKFLQEYLDMLCEGSLFAIHWSELTYSRSL